jgi:hypothetical protein
VSASQPQPEPVEVDGMMSPEDIDYVQRLTANRRPVSASQPLTGDELAAIKARAEAEAHPSTWTLREDVLRLVAEVERERNSGHIFTGTVYDTADEDE